MDNSKPVVIIRRIVGQSELSDFRNFVIQKGSLAESFCAFYNMNDWLESPAASKVIRLIKRSKSSYMDNECSRAPRLQNKRAKSTIRWKYSIKLQFSSWYWSFFMAKRFSQAWTRVSKCCRTALWTAWTNEEKEPCSTDSETSITLNCSLWVIAHKFTWIDVCWNRF